MNDGLIIKQLWPEYFPAVASEEIQRFIQDLEKLFKQPIKNVFPYPLDVKKVYNAKTGKLVKLVYDVALAGIPKENIKVQLKQGKYLTIKIAEPEKTEKEKENTKNENGEVEEYIITSRALSHKNGEITFRIFCDVDTTKFKPTFINGLLEIELYMKEQNKESDVITAVID